MPNDLNTNLALLLNGLGATPSGSVPVRLTTSTASASNVSTTETDLITYAMPANVLNSNNQSVRITTWGTLANNGNTKTIKVYFGATQVAALSGTAANVAYYSQSVVVRTSATAQTAVGSVQVSLSSQLFMSALPAETLSGAVTIKVTGQSGTASADVTALALLVEWLP